MKTLNHEVRNSTTSLRLYVNRLPNSADQIEAKKLLKRIEKALIAFELRERGEGES